MNILGISAGYHDASISIINSQGDILFAGHSERYSKTKNDPDIHIDLIAESGQWDIDHIAYYETPWKKQLRQLYSGQGIEWNKLSTRNILKNQLQGFFKSVPTSTHNHHLSHAAAGFQTSTFERATVVVIDAIGEWDTISIWGAEYDQAGQATYKRLWGQKYPHSIGLFYSAFTQRVGLRPLDEEYIMMGMSAYGERGFGGLIEQNMVADASQAKFKQNMHMGIDTNYLHYVSDMDIAAGAQDVLETLVYNIMNRARDFNWSNNLVYMGGVALNCLANINLGNYFDNIWIMPNPGDSGSSLGAAALVHRGQINWTNAYLGHNIAGPYPVNSILDHLLRDKIVGVASGRAEFGPRALGNRSLLADPRGPDIKEKVNEIKRRQQFRPFAPVILEEHAHEYFKMPAGFVDSSYMQVVGLCKRPDLFPAIVHADGTSRIQTVPKNGSGIRELLEKWYVLTDCPMLLNTSLNIRGEPMVNDRIDADRFEQLYNVKVCS